MITWTLSAEAANAILNVLGQLPTSSGVYPVLVDLTQQTEAATKQEPTAE
jgi:hypothetical protein